MKITGKCILILVLLFCIFSSSCRDSKIDEEIVKNADNLDTVLGMDTRDSLEEYFDGFTPETKYIPGAKTDLEGIYSPIYTIDNNKFYFPVRKRYETANSLGGIGIYSYVDLQTGDHHLICSDPLCKHIYEQCKYVDMTGAIFFAEPNVLYIEFVNWSIYRSEIYKVDLNADTIRSVYRCEDDITKQYAMILFIKRNKLYFSVTTNIESDENDSEKMNTQVSTLKIMDLSNGQIIESKDFPTDYVETGAFCSIIYIDGDTYYFSSLRDIFTANSNFKKQKTIYSFGPNEHMSIYYYDEKTKKLFFLVRNDKQMTGSVYVYANGELNELDMPHENIYSFQLTNNKIYYSPYDPVFLGVSPRDSDVYNYTGGKIYATDRNSRKESELVFDNGEKLLFGTDSLDYVIIGDYIYFPYMHFMDDGTFVWFSSALDLKQGRINLKENTIKYFGFE